MHPKEIIEFMIVAVIIIISFFLKDKWRKLGWSLALVVLLTYCAFYIVRPCWIDAKIDKKVELLELFLEQKYPNEAWEITTVPHRTNGFKHLNPYYIGVVLKTSVYPKRANASFC